MNIELNVGHIGLNVSELERSKAFYAEVFGLRVINESHEIGKRYAFLASDTVTLTLWEQSHDRFSPVTPGLHHLAFAVEKASEVRDYERKLRERGVEFIYDGILPHAEGSASSAIFFRDPDGIRLELCALEALPDEVGGNEAPHGQHSTCGFF